MIVIKILESALFEIQMTKELDAAGQQFFIMMLIIRIRFCYITIFAVMLLLLNKTFLKSIYILLCPQFSIRGGPIQ